jgi:hypothetical protein
MQAGFFLWRNIKGLLGRPRHKPEDNVEVDLKEMG